MINKFLEFLGSWYRNEIEKFQDVPCLPYTLCIQESHVDTLTIADEKTPALQREFGSECSLETVSFTYVITGVITPVMDLAVTQLHRVA